MDPFNEEHKLFYVKTHKIIFMELVFNVRLHHMYITWSILEYKGNSVHNLSNINVQLKFFKISVMQLQL